MVEEDARFTEVWATATIRCEFSSLPVWLAQSPFFLTAETVLMATEPYRCKTLVLRVSIHCEGCKKKVKKALQSVDDRGRKPGESQGSAAGDGAFEYTAKILQVTTEQKGKLKLGKRGSGEKVLGPLPEQEKNKRAKSEGNGESKEGQEPRKLEGNVEATAIHQWRSRETTATDEPSYLVRDISGGRLRDDRH
ncbi:hypothetical protein BRADI_2g27652v3 [Brachypodium distachyon]|uniref:HMA domain-containing protein n=1 Tax=Brachypodium distachyon TaxID=15368 RepID=A0A2K2DB07_BRADI|nr:hypothetical protein BRADI_2g27652v3 [Brachypodium distachyon]